LTTLIHYVILDVILCQFAFSVLLFIKIINNNRKIVGGNKVKQSEIDRAQYSALMDGDTCPSCASLEGKEWRPGAPEFKKYASGNPACTNKEGCRCMLVYISKKETKSVK
jgi:hypothetical protein